MKKTSCLLGMLLLGGCTAPTTTGGDIPAACQKSGVTTNDPVICPNVSPIVLVPSRPDCEKTFTFLVTNYSSRADLKIDSVSFRPEDAAIFYNPQVAPTTVKPGEDAVIQFNYKQQDLTEKRGEITIKSNARNFPELKSDVVIREGVYPDGGFGQWDGGAGEPSWCNDDG